MPAPAFDWSTPQRQSPVALVFILGKIIRESWLIILFLIGRKVMRDENKASSTNALYYVLAVLATLLLIRIHYLIQFFRFRISIHADELVVLSGVLTRKKMSIPLARVQSVHLTQNFLHRATGTCALKLETAGSGETELEIKAIRLDKAMALQLLVQEGQNEITSPPSAESSVNVLGIDGMDLMRLAISENHIKTLLLVLLFFFARIDDLRQFFGIDYEKAIGQEIEKVELTWRLLLALSGMVLLLTLLVSFSRVILRYYQMHLQANDKGFQLRWGFLQTQQKMLLPKKIQLVSWNSNWFRRVLGIHIFRFYMAGEFGAKERQWIQLPVMQHELLQQLISVYPSDLLPENTEKHGVDTSFGWRKTLILGLPVALVTSVFCFYWQPWAAWIPFVWLAYFALVNKIRQRRLIYWYNKHALHVRQGIWGTEEVILNLNKVQHVVIKSSPFQRSRKLATLIIHTAGAPVVIPYIPENQADWLANVCLANVEGISN